MECWQDLTTRLVAQKFCARLAQLRLPIVAMALRKLAAKKQNKIIRRRRKAAKWGSKKTFKLGSLRIHPIMSKMLLDNWSLQDLELWGMVWVLNGRLH